MSGQAGLELLLLHRGQRFALLQNSPAFALLQPLTQQRNARFVSRKQFQRLVNGVGACREVALQEASLTEIDVQTAILGRKLQSLLVGLDSRSQTLLRQQDITQIAAGRGISGIEFDGFPIGGAGRLRRS